MTTDELWAVLAGDNAPEPAALNARSELVERLYAYFGNEFQRERNLRLAVCDWFARLRARCLSWRRFVA